MRILYIADHRGLDNDDEGAIAFALAKLGHTLVRVSETISCADSLRRKCRTCDFILFHKWSDINTMRQAEIPKVFWYFDKVNQLEETAPQVEAFSKTRIKLLNNHVRYSDIGFLTDGDWVNEDTTGKLFKLSQGMDERIASIKDGDKDIDILFVGTCKWCTERTRHLIELQGHYRNKLVIVGNDWVNGDRVHARELQKLFTRSKIVLALDAPISDHYWSNRVYLTLGLGGFLIHPWSDSLTKEYTPGTELIYYHTREELIHLIDYYLEHKKEREELCRAGHERTLQSHLYRHRCEVLIQTIRERGIV